MKSAMILIFLAIPVQVWAWGVSATATTTVKARVTHWTEDPCDFPEHQDKCTIKRELNIPIVSQAPRQTNITNDGNIMNYE